MSHLPPSRFARHGTVLHCLERRASEAPDTRAIAYYGTDITFGDLMHQVRRLAGWLSAQGVVPGDRVAIQMQNSPQYIIAYHAVLAQQAIVVPLNPMYRAREVAEIVKDAGVQIAIVAEDMLDRYREPGSPALLVARYADLAPSDPVTPLPTVMTAPPLDALSLGSAERWLTALQTPPLQDLPGLCATLETPAVMPYTSGSTGAPKGCLHSHRSVLHTAAGQADWYGMTAQSVLTAVQPLFHVAGMQGSMNAGLCAGATQVVMTRWDADAAIKLFSHYGVTFWNAPPTMIVDMMSRGPSVPPALAHMEILTGGGTAMPDAVAARLRQDYGLEFVEGYGMSETMSPSHVNPLDDPRPGSIGVPFHDTLAMIIDPETLAPLPDGEIGEIAVSGPQIMLGYWNRPEADAETFFNHEGYRFLRTGDIGLKAVDGTYRVLDRLKRMINASGFKVWPTEIEGVLFEHPAIANCCVIASPDPYRGETVKALVQLSRDAELSEPALLDWLRPRLAAFKMPRQLVFVSELPLTASHKVDWRSLQQQEAANPASSAQ